MELHSKNTLDLFNVTGNSKYKFSSIFTQRPVTQEAFRPGVIKLADPITTDGFTTMNLSERFNPNMGDLGL